VEWEYTCSLFQPDPYLKLRKSELTYVGPIADQFSPVSGGFVMIAGRTAEIDIEANDSPHTQSSISAWIRGSGVVFIPDYTPGEQLITRRTLLALALGMGDGEWKGAWSTGVWANFLILEQPLHYPKIDATNFPFLLRN